MPWNHCDRRILDHDYTCPVCGADKPTAWTMRLNKTRVFQVGARKGFVQIVLLDTAEKPIPEIEYTVVVATGEEQRTGTLDHAGFALEEGLPALDCQITFRGVPRWRLEEAVEELRASPTTPSGRRFVYLVRPLLLDLEHGEPGLDTEVEVPGPPRLEVGLGVDPGAPPARFGLEVDAGPPPAQFGLETDAGPSLGFEAQPDDSPSPAFEVTTDESASPAAA